MSVARKWLKQLFHSYSGDKKHGQSCKEAQAQRSEPRLPMPDPPTLSDEQKQLVRASWLELQSEIYHVGVVSFISLFENKLEFKHSFSQFKDLNSDELRSSPLVKAHAMAILHVIEQLVNRIDCTEKWPEIIDGLGKNHTGTDAKHYLAQEVAAHCWKSMEPILIQRGKYSEEVEKTWLQIIGWLGQAMASSMRKYLEPDPAEQVAN